MSAKGVSGVKCSIEINDKIFLEKDGVNKVICDSNGRVVEMCNEKIIAICDIPFFNPSEISVFYSYDPFIKYYIVYENTTIIVLKKLNGLLEVIKKYENVQKYEINDFLVIGRPLVKFWLLGEMEPLITDFSRNNLSNINNRNELQRMSDLNRKLHLMQSSLNGINTISESRKQIQENYFKHQFNYQSCLILFKEPWQRIIDGRWVICIPIKNSYDCDVNYLYLLVNNNVYEIETRVCYDFHFSSKDFFSKNVLLSNSCAYVVGIINEPNFSFLRNSIKLSCSLFYNVLNNNSGNIKELKIDPFELRAEDLINRNLDVFCAGDVNSISQNIVTITAINGSVALELHFKNIVSETMLIDILMNKLHFSKQQIFKDEGICYCVEISSDSILSGLITFLKNISENVYSLICYPKTVHQLAFLKEFLMVFFKDELLNIFERRTNDGNVSERSIVAAVNTLDDEFKHFISVLRKAISESSSVLPNKHESSFTFTVETWKDLVESTLQFDTDLKFQNAVKDMANVDMLSS